MPKPTTPDQTGPKPTTLAADSAVASTDALKDDKGGPERWLGAMEKLLTALGPPTVVGALLYYFGWARTHSLFSYFGIDADSVGLSTTDYVLRSASAVWPSLGGLVLLVLLGLAGHGWLIRRLAGTEPPARTAATLCFAALGSALLVLGALQFSEARRQGSLLAPLSLAAGFAALGYASYLHRLLKVDDGGTRETTGPRTAIGGLFIALVVLSAFWATAIFAERLGQGRAEYLEAHHFDAMPDVLIYSSYRLRLDPRDVTETDLGPEYAPYRFRYDGLKLFTRGEKKMVLIPYSWSTKNAFALVLPDDKDVRVVFAPNF